MKLNSKHKFKNVIITFFNLSILHHIVHLWQLSETEYTQLKLMKTMTFK